MTDQNQLFLHAILHNLVEVRMTCIVIYIPFMRNCMHLASKQVLLKELGFQRSNLNKMAILK